MKYVKPKPLVIYSHIKINTLQWNITCYLFYESWQIYVIVLIFNILYLRNEIINKNLSDRIEVTCVKYVKPKPLVINSHIKVNTLQWNIISLWVLTEVLRYTWLSANILYLRNETTNKTPFTPCRLFWTPCRLFWSPCRFFLFPCRLLFYVSSKKFIKYFFLLH